MHSLDRWLPDPAVRVCHSRTAAAEPARLWERAQSMPLREAGRLASLVRWRIPGTPGDLPFGDLFRRYPFMVLEEGDQHLISGLAGRIWTLQRDYPRLSGAEEFEHWDEPGTVRVAFAHWVEHDGAGTATLSTEARIAPTDRYAALRLRALWAVIGPFEGLVGSHGLRAAVSRVDQQG